MTSKRTFVSSLVGAVVILLIGLLLLQLSLAVGGPFVIFALAVAAWGIGAYNRKKWAWRAAVCFAYALAALFVVGTLVFSSRVLIGATEIADPLAYVAVVVACTIAAVAGIVLSFRRSLRLIYEERAQFFSG